MQRRKFINQSLILAAGSILFPHWGKANSQATTKITIPSQQQVRHGLFSTQSTSQSTHWWQSLQHHRFLSNGIDTSDNDWVLYTFDYKKESYHIGKNALGVFTNIGGPQQFLTSTTPISHANLTVGFAPKKLLLSEQKNYLLLPITEGTRIQNTEVQEGEVIHIQKTTKQLNFNKSILFISYK